LNPRPADYESAALPLSYPGLGQHYKARTRRSLAVAAAGAHGPASPSLARGFGSRGAAPRCHRGLKLLDARADPGCLLPNGFQHLDLPLARPSRLTDIEDTYTCEEERRHKSNERRAETSCSIDASAGSVAQSIQAGGGATTATSPSCYCSAPARRIPQSSLVVPRRCIRTESEGSFQTSRDGADRNRLGPGYRLGRAQRGIGHRRVPPNHPLSA
jgi:hypothetical protein